MEWIMRGLSSVNWAALSYASVLLLWLSILGTSLSVGVMLALNGLLRWSEKYASGVYAETWLSLRIVNLIGELKIAQKMAYKWLPRFGMLMIGYVIGQAQIFNPVHEYHQVTVLSPLENHKYEVLIPSAPINKGYQHDSREFWKVCQDGDPMPWVAGMVMTIVQFKQRADCLFFDSETEVKYLNDAKHNVVDSRGKLLFAKENN